VVLFGLVVAWALSPTPAQLQARVAASAAAGHVVLLDPGQVPALLADALVATEDERFNQHHGIDGIGLGRAVSYDIWNRCFCQGGSTLTEQLVKLVYLGDDHGWNKVVDTFLAFKLESGLDKRRILADYLSVVPTGAGLTGAPAAACTYFGKPLGQLDLAQLALIAGMPQAPYGYDPRYHPDRAAGRRSHVLGAMVGEGYITRDEATAADAQPLLPDPKPAGCQPFRA